VYEISVISALPTRRRLPGWFFKYGKKSTGELDLPQTYGLRAKLAADQKARNRDLPNFVDIMITTGKRIDENSAITWDTLDLDADTVEICGTVIRVKGHGLRIRSGTSGGGRPLARANSAMARRIRQPGMVEDRRDGGSGDLPVACQRDGASSSP